MITLELTDSQAKLLYILTGMCAGTLASNGVYNELREKLGFVDYYTDHTPIAFTTSYDKVELYSLEVTQEMIDRV